MQVLTQVRNQESQACYFSYREVLYYSNDILSRVLPEAGPYVSLGITLVNTLMTFPPIFLIDVGVAYVFVLRTN